MSGDTTYQQCGCKIGQAIDSYGLDKLNTTLIDRYQHQDASLRDLADVVNERILRAALKRHDDNLDIGRELFGALDRDEAIAAIYNALVDDETSADQRARVRTRLEQAGIDLKSVKADWVTHPTVRSHLRECCEVETTSKKEIDATSANQTIEWAQSRCQAIVERTLERLQRTDAFTIASPEVSISIRITCTECQESYRPSELITADACGCSRSDSESTDAAGSEP
ncbi:MAG: rod-determining factor RdfA [Halobacteriales archaeon]